MADDPPVQASAAASATAVDPNNARDGAASPTDESASAALDAKNNHAAELAELTGRTSALMLKEVSA